MKSVLFVDDDPNILSGLKRMLRHMRHEWNMEFFDNGTDALAFHKNAPCDVIVSDMLMPGMDGVELLSTVRDLYPESIRIALSGRSDSNMIYRCIKHAHQYIAKPSDADELVETINRACKLQDHLTDTRLKSLISNLTSLPIMPESYERIMDELQSDNASIGNIGNIIESDIAMSIKILQLVNSAYFGIPRHVSSPSEATMLLGVDVIKNIVLTCGIFSQFDPEIIRVNNIGSIWSRGIIIGALSRYIVMEHTNDKVMSDYASMGGMLCDVGTFVLATSLPNEIAEAQNICDKQGRLDWDVERELLGYSHMEIGAYLGALWGLPNPIIEAVAFHHQPENAVTHQFNALTAVHVANAMVRSVDGKEFPGLNHEYVESLGISEYLPEWFAISKNMLTDTGS
ncbi:MAG: HD-like signal output (HDOD) protein/CheY-like chemotaxis protein [Granulosicoccus sp.]|jgi:HD-like signal output (HDOD) protein/CheY-like chemotaxis protein